MSWYRNALLAEFKQARDDYEAGVRGADEPVVYFPYARADVPKFVEALERDKHIEEALAGIRDELLEARDVRLYLIATEALSPPPTPDVEKGDGTTDELDVQAERVKEFLERWEMGPPLSWEEIQQFMREALPAIIAALERRDG